MSEVGLCDQNTIYAQTHMATPASSGQNKSKKKKKEEKGAKPRLFMALIMVCYLSFLPGFLSGYH